jgi:Tfp pilus assembly protein PilF
LIRRDFLHRCSQWISASFLLPRLALPEPLRFHPKYPATPKLEALFQKTNAAFDDFPTEIQHDRVAAILASWPNLEAIEKSLAPDFLGTSPRPVESKLIRPGDTLTVHHLTFSSEPTLTTPEFLKQFQLFEKLLTAEFQITQIAGDARSLQTRVRYEFVGSGKDFHREQRVGFWDLEWEGYHLRRWIASDEIRSRSIRPVFSDRTANTFGQNSSYHRQLLQGVDHWRAVIDGACGIDIYGHNGVSVADIDNDGYDDLYICQPAGLPNRLYRNRGDGTFEDITELSGLGLLDNTACALFADFDNDGWQDVVVVRASGPLLFINQRNNTFRLKNDAFHFANPPQGTFTGAAAGDYNRDGLLDIYFCLYVFYQGTDQYNYPSPYFDADNGPANFLMRNNGDGTFIDVTALTGLDKNNSRFSFCCGWNDYKNDGFPDLYVVNDFGRKNLYRNNGNGTFTDVAAEAGVEDVGAGMSVSWFDYDNDGSQDLYVADMWTAAGERVSGQPTFKVRSSEAIRKLYRKHSMGNSLFRSPLHSDPKETFTDATNAAQVGMGRWSWSSDAWDFDHDGFSDLYIANGMLSGSNREDLNSFFWRQVVANSPDEAKPDYLYEQGWSALNELIRADYTWSGYERNVFYANNRDGTFSDISGAIGLDFLEDGRAFALADMDHDGRQEVFLKNRNAPQLRMLKNVMDPLPPSISFRLRGTRSNRDAIGAAITLNGQTRTLQAGSGFLSQHSKDIFFGLGDTKGPVSAIIRWPSGLVQQLSHLLANHRIFVEEGNETIRHEPFGHAPNVSIPNLESPREPNTTETWLLDPLPAPTTQPGLVTIRQDDESETASLYNLIYRYLFDRHRDLSLPTSFLIDAGGQIVKIYQGPVNPAQVEQDLQRIPRTPSERIAKALPFPGVSATYEYGRNHLSYGSVFFQHGFFHQAKVFFATALRDDPQSAEAHYGLGSVDLKEDNLTAAKSSFEQAVKNHASYPDTQANAWNNLGLIATREGRGDEAVRCLKEALRVNPDHFISLENLGNAYRQQERFEDSREVFLHALTIRPDDAEANYGLALVYAQTDQPEKAYDYFQRALKARPNYPEALNNLGILFLRTHRRDQAVAEFEECMRVAPDFDQSYLNLARVYAIEGTQEKARAVLGELLKRQPGNAQARQTLEQLP